MLLLTGYMYVQPDQAAAFAAELPVLSLATRWRDGSISSDAAVDDAQAGRLLVAERWRDQPALTAHLQASDTVAFIERWQGSMKGEIRKYDAGNERSVMDG
jgi:quinol monooxygenase YgiN